MTSTFGFFTGVGKYVYFPGAPYIISFVLIAICLILFLKRSSKNS